MAATNREHDDKNNFTTKLRTSFCINVNINMDKKSVIFIFIDNSLFEDF